MADDKKEEKKDKKEEKGGKKEEKEEAKKEGEAAPAEGAEGAEPISDEEKAKRAKKKKLILIAALALAILMGVGAAVFLVIKTKQPQVEAPAEEGAEGHGEHGTGGESGAAKGPAEGQPVFVDLPEFLVNLNSTGKQTSFLKIVVTLDVPDEKAKIAIESNMPRIRDNFQVYLHELRVEDLKGSAGLQLLREELLLRINRVIYPQKINDILFKEVLVQ